MAASDLEYEDALSCLFFFIFFFFLCVRSEYGEKGTTQDTRTRTSFSAGEAGKTRKRKLDGKIK